MARENILNNKRIAKNTIVLYIRTIIVLIVSLFTSRIILQALGVDDFGIYNVVGGIVVLFQFLNSSLSEATRRFVTFELGKGDSGDINKVFVICLQLHLILAIILTIVAEPLGLWVINNKMMFPIDRINAAEWVFHFSVASMFLMIVSLPYDALIVAHEKMNTFAFISIFEVIVKLSIAYIILYCQEVDRLILYGSLMLMLKIILRVIYVSYCRKKLLAPRFVLNWNQKLVNEMVGFMSWIIIGSVAYMGVTQGINVLLGFFFPPAINAARGVAVQVQGAITRFVTNFQTAINPQITKSYAAGRLEDMQQLIFRSSKFSFFLLMIPLLPLVVETDYVLNLWLVKVPENSAPFIRILLLVSLIKCFSNPLGTAAKATGQVRGYEMYAMSVKLFVLPVSYFLLKMNYPPISVFVVCFIFELLSLVSNVFITKELVHFNILYFIKEVVIRNFFVFFCSLIAALGVSHMFSQSFLRLCIVAVTSFFVSIILISIFGLNNAEKNYISSCLKKYINRNEKV